MIITMQMVIARGDYNNSLDKTSIGFKSDHQLDKLYMIILTICITPFINPPTWKLTCVNKFSCLNPIKANYGKKINSI